MLLHGLRSGVLAAEARVLGDLGTSAKTFSEPSNVLLLTIYTLVLLLQRGVTLLFLL